MALQIVDFLPFYPEVTDALLQEELYRKKEFFDFALTETEQPVEKGKRRKLNQQTVIERYFSEFTPYDEGLIYHAMGTGKTCAAFSLAEALKHRKAYRRCIVMARGDDSLDNLRRELVNKCSEDYKIDGSGMKPDEIDRKTKKIVRDFYSFKTYYSFAKDISGMPDEVIEKNYAGTLFIVDESHNIQEVDMRDTKLNIYAQFHRAFHLPFKRKILFLSGTPMRDDVGEIANLMNLLLPLDMQLPSGNEFKNSFLTQNPDGTFTVRADMEGRLKGFFRGRISYLGEPRYDIPIEWKGSCITGSDIPQFRSVALTMDRFQSDGYTRAYASDTTGDASGIYNNSMQASLFVFPDGSWGPEGFAKYKSDKSFFSSLKSLDTLKQYSIKYYHVVREIQRNKGKNIFVYCSVVHGSGVLLLARILEAYGFARYTGSEKMRGNRYSILTSETPKIMNIVNGFNRGSNKRGAFCQVILGSRKIAEGYSFKNIQVELLLTQYWNESEISQASRRGARFGSWNALRVDGVLPANLSLSISKVCAFPRDQTPALDLMMLETSRRKDISIKRIDRVIKESAYDCPLFYERNRQRGAKENSRECDYTGCEYKCDAPFFPEEGGVDISTYELYYENYFDLVSPIMKLFSARDMYSLETIEEIIHPQEKIQLLKALSYIIDNNITVTNRYRRDAYLREHVNIYFLVQNVERSEFEFSDLSNPVFAKQVSLDSVIKKLHTERSMELLSELQEAKDIGDVAIDPDVRDLLVKLSLKERFLAGNRRENCLAVLDYFKEYIFYPQDEVSYYAVYVDSNEVTWCLKKDGWVKCKAKTTKEKKPEASEEERKGTPELQLGYEGIIGEDDKFCIRKIVSKADKRKTTTGAVCEQAGWRKDKLLALVDELGIPTAGVTLRVKKDICELLRSWFKKKGALKRGKCGTAAKKKGTFKF